MDKRSTGSTTPLHFRELDIERQVFLWDKVSRLAKGKIYAGGTINDFLQLTGWLCGRVMYFGDHPYADLADVTLHHGWKTAAVIRELEKVIGKRTSLNTGTGTGTEQKIPVRAQ
jgi:hypothetical protein